GRSALWGLAFVLLPAAFASFDRMTVDAALLAVVVALLWALETRRERWVWAFLVLAPLVRETGVLVVAGVVLARSATEGWRRGARFLVVLLPWVAWAAFVH